MPPSRSADVPLLDAVVVGGGINGVGIARDLAGRGAKVLLCEKDDLARVGIHKSVVECVKTAGECRGGYRARHFKANQNEPD